MATDHEHASYLERTGVSKEIKIALSELVQKRPRDPLSYLARHFEQVMNPERDPVAAAAKLLHDCSLSPPSLLESTVYKAFALLSDSTESSRVLTSGVNGSQYNKLLKELCCNMDTANGDSLLKQLQVAEEGTVLFPVFQTATMTCLSLQEYLQVAEELFQLLDESGRGTIGQSMGEGVLAQLNAAFTSAASNTMQSLQQAKMLLQPGELARFLQHMNPKESDVTSINQITSSEFKRLAAKLFIDHLAPSNKVL